MAFVSSSSGIVIVDSRSNSGSIRLPAASTLVGRSLIFKDGFNSFGSHPLGLSTTGVDRFDNLSSVLTVGEKNGFVSLVAGSNKWHTVGGTHLVNQNVDNMNISTINGIVINNSIYVVGSTNGILSYTVDNINWINCSSQPLLGYNISAIVYNGSYWIAGSTGAVNLARSPDGINWISVKNPSLGAINSIIWNGSKWIVVCEAGIGSSADGINWTLDTISYPLYGIDYNGTTYVVVGYNYSYNVPIVRYSTDLITWTDSPTNISEYIGPNIQRVKWNGSLWVIGGVSITNKFMYSADGINWSPTNSTAINPVYSIEWNGSIWVAGGIKNDSYGGISYSSDGITWTGSSSADSILSTYTGNIQNIKWDGKLFLAVGYYQNSPIIITSPDGINWNLKTRSLNTSGLASIGYSSSAPPIVGVISTSDKLLNINLISSVVGLGSAGYLSSFPNNLTISSITLTNSLSLNYTDTIPTNVIPSYPFTSSFNVVAYGNGQWLAGGLEGNVSSIALLSNNNWIPITTNLKRVNSISYGNGKWLATGIPKNNTVPPIQVSVDGISWSNAVFTVNLSSFVGNTIAYGSNFWLCGGTSSSSNYSLQTSVDGYNWLGQSSPLSNVYSLTYGPFENGYYYWVLGGYGYPGYPIGTYDGLYYSTDGSNWTNFYCPLNGGQANTVAFGDDNARINFIGGGFDGSYNNANSIQVFSYGSGGLAPGSNNLNIVNSIAYNNGVWVSVGQKFSTFSNAIQVSPNGFNWSPISTNMAIGQTVAYGGGQWIAGGYTAASTAIVQYSIDGFHWSFSNYSTCTLSTVVTANSNGLIVNGAQRPPALTENFCVTVGGDANGAVIATSYDGINWVKQYNTQHVDFVGIAYNGSIWIAVNSTVGGPSIFTSSDGFNWSSNVTAPIGPAGYCTGISWNGSYWLITGNSFIGSATVMLSQDGYNWSLPLKTPFGAGNAAIGANWNGSYWLAAGLDGAGNNISISYDGLNWSSVPSILFSGVSGKNVVWNGTYWVAIALGGQPIAISYDGYNWTPSLNNPFFNNPVYGVAWNGSYWVAVGSGPVSVYIAKSFNGLDWVPSSNNPLINIYSSCAKGITWNGSLWVVVGSGKQIATSIDGSYWTPIEAPLLSPAGILSAVANRKVEKYNASPPQNLNISSITFPGLPNTTFNTSYSYGRTDYGSTLLGITSTNIQLYLCNATTVAYGNGLWLVAGYSSNTNDNNANTVILRSSDTSNWAVSFLTPFNTSINSIVYGSNRWVAVGQDGATGSNSIYTSIDAITWVPSCNNPLYLNGFSQYNSVTYGGGNKWVAVGTNVGSNLQAIVYSTDGLTWSLASNNPFTEGAGYSVGYGNGLWIAGGSATSNIATSSNGIDWNAAQSNPFYNGIVLDIKYANGLWIAVGLGTGYNIMSSPDGSNWTPSSLGTASLKTAAYGDGKWIVSGLGGMGHSMFIGTDGINWSSITNNFEGVNSYGNNSIAYGNGVWLDVGNYTTTKFISTIQTSANGLDWTLGTASQTLSTLQYASNFSYVSSFSTFSSPITIVNSTMSNVVSITSNSININGSPYSPPYFQTSALNLNYIDTGDDIPSHPFTNSITSIAYGNNQWLAAGSNTGCNIIAMWNYSNAWVTVYNNSQAINNLSYNNNQWLGVGSNIIVVSLDGYTWSNATSFTPAVLNTVAYNSTFWLAGGQTLSNTGSIQLSADGFNWYSQSTLISSINSITYASNIWVAVGSTIETSYDGSNWLPQSSFLQQGNTLAYSDVEGLWLSGGFDSNHSRSSIQLSLDASNWGFAYSYDLNIVNSIAYNDNFKFVAVGKNANCASNAIIYSYNGSVWYTPSTIMGVGTTIAYGNNLAIAGGYTSDGKPVIQYSDNGEFWLSYHVYNKINSTIITSFHDNLLVNGEPKIQTGSFIGANISLYYDSIINDVPRENVNIVGSDYSNVNAILYANNVLMIGINGGNTLSNSPDSIQVLNNNVWVPQLNGMPNINGIDYGNGAWVSVGYTSFNQQYIQTSSDGSNWTPTTSSGNAPGFCVKYANGIWLVGDIGGSDPKNACSMQRSTDGYNWYSQSNYLDLIQKIEYGNGVWVAVGCNQDGSATVESSSDSSNWFVHSSNTLFCGYTVKYANNLWIVGGSNNVGDNTTTIQTSPDASNDWTAQSNNFVQVNDIAYNNGIWLAVGSNATNSNQCIQTSPDGSNWTAQTASYLIYAKSIAYSNGVWMVGGQALVNYGGGHGPNAVGLIEYSYDTINWTSTFVGTKEVTASTIVTGASNSILLNGVPVGLYIPSNPSIWEAPPPSTIQTAIDRLASFLSAFTSSNIPL